MGVSADFFTPFKELSKFFIILAMVAIGLNTNVIQLIKKRWKTYIIRIYLLDQYYLYEFIYATYIRNLVKALRSFFC